MKRIWVGKYQSDTAYTSNYFQGSISYYGDNCNGNVSYLASNPSKFNEEFNSAIFLEFVYTIMIEQIKKEKVIFTFYNQLYAQHLIKRHPILKQYISPINEENVLNWLSVKTFVRAWLENSVKVPPFTVLSKSECAIENLSLIFPGYKQFIIQDNTSSGGQGTFILRDESEQAVLAQLSPSIAYMVSPYLTPNYSICVHAVIQNKSCIIMQPSIQIVYEEKTKMIFHGGDFGAARQIDIRIRKEIDRISHTIGKRLSDIGYRGICGMDFIVYSGQVYFIEINPRFLGSSIIVNKCLLENGLPNLYMLNEKAFTNTISSDLQTRLATTTIRHSIFKVKNYSTEKFNYSTVENCKEIEEVYRDGYTSDLDNGKQGYIAKFICSQSLVALTQSGSARVYQNLMQDQKVFQLSENLDDWIYLKVALITQGIIITSSAKSFFCGESPMKQGTFDAIDLHFPNGVIVNTPLRIPFLCFSPFELKCNNQRLALYYCGKFLSFVEVETEDKIAIPKTKYGIPYSYLVQRTTDRLRIRHNSVCCFKSLGRGCLFCHAKNLEEYNLDYDDIKSAIAYYNTALSFRHFMIGGASNEQKEESEIIKAIIGIIRELSDKPIYIMSLPPADLKAIEEYKKLGATEIAFNIEVFDPYIAQKIMPGKGSISRKEYLIALEKAVSVFGGEGQVRSMLMIGLESTDSTLCGVKSLCELKVSPMLTPFRPMAGTALQNHVPPTINECLEVYQKSKKICDNYGVTLGPSCSACQNNTLSLPIFLEEHFSQIT